MSSNPGIERPLPHYLLAEQSILGVVLLNNSALATAIEKGLTAADFFLPENRNIYESMLRLDEARTPIDIVTVAEDLHRHGKLESSGGHPYISQLPDGMPRVLNVEHYSKIVKDKAVLRGLIRTAENIQERAFDATQDV